MKYLFLTACLTLTVISYAQTDQPAISAAPFQGKVFTVVEQMPSFPGGDDAMMKFIRENIKYPKFEMNNDIQGRVVIGFIVEVDGSLSNIEVKKGVSTGIDKEAVRVVQALPKFKPGKQQGVPVRVNFILPIMFKLADEPVKKK